MRCTECDTLVRLDEAAFFERFQVSEVLVNRRGYAHGARVKITLTFHSDDRLDTDHAIHDVA